MSTGPDVMLTYGGDPITQGMMALAKHRAIPVVFGLHNFAYKFAGHFSQDRLLHRTLRIRRGIIAIESALTARRCPTRSTGSACGHPQPAVCDFRQSGSL